MLQSSRQEVTLSVPAPAWLAESKAQAWLAHSKTRPLEIPGGYSERWGFRLPGGRALAYRFSSLWAKENRHEPGKSL